MRRLGLGAGISRRVGTRNGPSLDLNFLSGALDSRVTFARASTATRFNASGVLETVASGAPRFDYDPVTLAAKGLLLEEARTNLRTNSADMATVFATQEACSFSANAATAPDGTVTADKMVEDGATGNHRVRSGVTVAAVTTVHTSSLYLKAAGRTSATLILADSTSSVANNVAVTANLTAGTLGSVTVAGTGVSSGASIQNCGNGWYRVSLAGSFAAGTTFATWLTLGSYAGDGASGVYLWGAQLEAGSFSTSFIPTTGAAVTRAADVATVTPLTPWFNAAAGTVVAEFTPQGVTGLQTVVYFDDATSNERMGIRASAGTNSMLAVDGAAAQALAGIGAIVAETTYRSGFAYAVNDFAGCQNGGTVTTDTAGTLPTVTRMLIGSRLAASEILSGHYRQVRYWPTRRSNTALQALTV